MDFEDYKEIDALTDERSELEEKYFEILNILDENQDLKYRIFQVKIH